MIKNILLILLLTLCLLIYTLFLKPTPQKETLLAQQSAQEVTPSKQEIPKPKKEVPKIELKYYNLSLDNDYKKLYEQNNPNLFGQHIAPPLSKEEREKLDDIDISLRPEFNFDKQTKEITIDGVKIQLEKKF
jgi:hypothetical protein